MINAQFAYAPRTVPLAVPVTHLQTAIKETERWRTAETGRFSPLRSLHPSVSSSARLASGLLRDSQPDLMLPGEPLKDGVEGVAVVGIYHGGGVG